MVFHCKMSAARLYTDALCHFATKCMDGERYDHDRQLNARYGAAYKVCHYIGTAAFSGAI